MQSCSGITNRQRKGLGQLPLVNVLEIQLQAFAHCFDWHQMLQGL